MTVKEARAYMGRIDRATKNLTKLATLEVEERAGIANEADFLGDLQWTVGGIEEA